MKRAKKYFSSQDLWRGDDDDDDDLWTHFLMKNNICKVNTAHVSNSSNVNVSMEIN